VRLSLCPPQLNTLIPSTRIKLTPLIEGSPGSRGRRTLSKKFAVIVNQAKYSVQQRRCPDDLNAIRERNCTCATSCGGILRASQGAGLPSRLVLARHRCQFECSAPRLFLRDALYFSVVFVNTTVVHAKLSQHVIKVIEGVASVASPREQHWEILSLRPTAIPRAALPPRSIQGVSYHKQVRTHHVSYILLPVLCPA
jgi:hypothetical protein